MVDIDRVKDLSIGEINTQINEYMEYLLILKNEQKRKNNLIISLNLLERMKREITIEHKIITNGLRKDILEHGDNRVIALLNNKDSVIDNMSDLNERYSYEVYKCNIDM